MPLDALLNPQVDAALAAPPANLRELAKTLREEALAKALRHHRAYAQDERLLAQDLQRPAVVEAFKDGLAQGVARVLGAHVPQVLTVYTYNPSANPDNESGEACPPDATLHLLVCVAAPAAAVHTLIAALDSALTASLRELSMPLFQLCTGVLDIRVFTMEDVQQRAGDTRLLTSIFAPPIIIWER